MWLMNGTAVQGRGHISEGTPCQDKIDSKCNDTTYVIALADGAGSASLSHIGAANCVEVITQYFLENFEECYAIANDIIKQNIYDTLVENLEQLALANNCSIKELASTLLCVAVKDKRFITFHLGDGIIAYNDGQSLRVYSAPDNGEFSNVTYFVTSSNALSKIRVRKEEIPNATAFYLMSDGAGISLYSPQQNAVSNALKMMSDLSLLYSSNDVLCEITAFFEQSVRVKTLDDCSVAYMVKYKKTTDILDHMSYAEQLDLFCIHQGSRHEQKRYRRYRDIIKYCECENSLRKIAKKIGLKPKYAKKYVNVLLKIGLLKVANSNTFINANNPKVE